MDKGTYQTLIIMAGIIFVAICALATEIYKVNTEERIAKEAMHSMNKSVENSLKMIPQPKIVINSPERKKNTTSIQSKIYKDGGKIDTQTTENCVYSNNKIVCLKK